MIQSRVQTRQTGDGPRSSGRCFPVGCGAHKTQAAKDNLTNRRQKTLGPMQLPLVLLWPASSSVSVLWFALVWVARTEWAKVVARHGQKSWWWGSKEKESTRRGVRQPSKAASRHTAVAVPWSYAARTGSLHECKLLERCRGGIGQRAPLGHPSTLGWLLRLLRWPLLRRQCAAGRMAAHKLPPS